MKRLARTVLVLSSGAVISSSCGSAGASSGGTDQKPAPHTVARPSGAPEPVIAFTLAPPAYNGPLPPLPQVPYALPRSAEIVQAVYTFAARHPEVLHYVPCFCGCQRSGHKDNDDCFIKSRDPKGRPEWESHGMG
jgi:hypothetical protein